MNFIPDDVKRDITVIAPMLEKLGYDPYANPPKYGDPDRFVAENTEHIKNNEDFWKKKGMEVLYQDKDKAKVAPALRETKGEGAAAQIYKDDSKDGIQTENGDGEHKMR